MSKDNKRVLIIFVIFIIALIVGAYFFPAENPAETEKLGNHVEIPARSE